MTGRPFASGLEPFSGTVGLTGVTVALAFLAPYLTGLVAALGALALAAWMARRTRRSAPGPAGRGLGALALAGVVVAELLLLARGSSSGAPESGLLLFGCLAALWWADRRGSPFGARGST